MTKEEVQALYSEFCSHIETEREYREELLRLRFYGKKETEPEIAEKLSRHDELIESINRNRHKKILPILETLMKFVASKSA